MNQNQPDPRFNSLVGEKVLREIIWPDASCRPSRRWVLQLKADGKLPFHRIGRRIFFCPAEVRHFLDTNFRIAAKS